MRASTLHRGRSAGRTSPLGNEGAGHSTTMKRSARIMEVGIEWQERERERERRGERGGGGWGEDDQDREEREGWRKGEGENGSQREREV